MDSPQIEYGNGDDPRTIKIRMFEGKVQMLWDEPNEGFSFTPTQARQVAASLRLHADRAQKEAKKLARK